MGAIRLIQTPQDGQITFTVPDEMRNETIVIEFKPLYNSTNTKLIETSQTFFDNLTRKKIDFSEDDFSPYEQ